MHGPMNAFGFVRGEEFAEGKVFTFNTKVAPGFSINIPNFSPNSRTS